METLTNPFSSLMLAFPPKFTPATTRIGNLKTGADHRGSKSISCMISESSTAASGLKGMMRNPPLAEDYNTAMKRMMRNPYEYHHDLGMNYTLVSDSLIVGSQPQKPEDIDHLKVKENVAYILCLQQDTDIEYWGIDFDANVKRCKEVGVRHMRRPAKDFDPDSLRGQLPKAVSSLEWAISEGKGRVYVHCTAGLGRAPAVAIAYMFWFSDMDANLTDTWTLDTPLQENAHILAYDGKDSTLGWQTCPTAGYYLFFGDNFISWCNKKQDIVSVSSWTISFEVEYRVITSTTKDIVHIWCFLADLGFIYHGLIPRTHDN